MLNPSIEESRILEESSQSDLQKFSFNVRFNDSLKYFEGHFPEFKLLPGVALLKITLDILPGDLKGANPKSIERLKYTGVILPNSELTLELTVFQGGRSVEFTWGSSEKSYASGRLLF